MCLGASTLNIPCVAKFVSGELTPALNRQVMLATFCHLRIPTDSVELGGFGQCHVSTSLPQQVSNFDAETIPVWVWSQRIRYRLNSDGCGQTP